MEENQIKLGKVAFTDAGVYSSTATYRKWDFVVTSDSCYLSLQDSNTGHPLPASGVVTDWWKCLADGKPVTDIEQRAVEATDAANAAATLANDKATLANTAAATANEKATLANAAASTASTAAASANTAASNANTKADVASGAADTANAAASSANASATRCGTATASANEAATSCNNAETATETAEAARVTAENSRVEAESGRVTEFNTIRTNAATATSSANTAATRAEAAAVVSEELNAHPSYIGDDDYWYEYDISTHAYVKSTQATGDTNFATFSLDPATGMLSCITASKYSGPTFALVNNMMTVTFNS